MSSDWGIWVYTTSACRYCARTKALLRKKKVTWQEVDCSLSPEARYTLLDVLKLTSLPQVWFGEQHMGGHDDLFRLEKEGRLDDALREAHVAAQLREGTPVPPPHEAHVQAVVATDDATAVPGRSPSSASAAVTATHASDDDATAPQPAKMRRPLSGQDLQALERDEQPSVPRGWTNADWVALVAQAARLRLGVERTGLRGLLTPGAEQYTGGELVQCLVHQHAWTQPKADRRLRLMAKWGFLCYVVDQRRSGGGSDGSDGGTAAVSPKARKRKGARVSSDGQSGDDDDDDDDDDGGDDDDDVGASKGVTVGVAPNAVRASDTATVSDGATDAPSAAPPSIPWQNDAEVTSCPTCNRSFTLLLRRHHCRACGFVFCNKCTAGRAWVAKLQRQARVCFACAARLAPSLPLDLSRAVFRFPGSINPWLLNMDRCVDCALDTNVDVYPVSEDGLLAGDDDDGGDDDDEEEVDVPTASRLNVAGYRVTFPDVDVGEVSDAEGVHPGSGVKAHTVSHADALHAPPQSSPLAHIPIPLTPMSAERLAKMLRQKLVRICETFLSTDGLRLDYAAIKQSRLFSSFEQCAIALQTMDPGAMSVTERTAFFINVYNALVIHAVIRVGPPRGPLQRANFFSRVSYRIGKQTFSLDDIEHGILRNNITNVWPLDDPRTSLCVPLDPRVHFALVCGAKSCPPIRVFSGPDLDAELTMATSSFVASQTRLTHSDTNPRCAMSKLFWWYRADFGSDPTQVLRWVATYLSPHDSHALLQWLDAGIKVPIDYEAYVWDLNSAM